MTNDRTLPSKERDTGYPLPLDEAIRRIGLKMEVRKQDPWSEGMVMWAEIGEIQTLLDSIERLRGLRPELPPRPPDGSGLPRYGLRHNGPGETLATPMEDGYWTPWHLADRAHEFETSELLVRLREILEWITGMSNDPPIVNMAKAGMEFIDGAPLPKRPSSVKAAGPLRERDCQCQEGECILSQRAWPGIRCRTLKANASLQGESRAEFERDRGFVRRCPHGVEIHNSQDSLGWAFCEKCPDCIAQNGRADGG